MPALTKVEMVILEILADYPDDEILERELRALVQRRGLRRSAPAFVFTMMSLHDKGHIISREVTKFFDGRQIKERYYALADTR